MSRTGCVVGYATGALSMAGALHASVWYFVLAAAGAVLYGATLYIMDHLWP